jgi:hypothetical protein
LRGEYGKCEPYGLYSFLPTDALPAWEERMTMLDKQPYVKIWTEHGFVLVDEQVGDDLLRLDLEVRLLERDGYPQVFASGAPIGLLHVWVDNYYFQKGLSPRLPPRWEIHHANRKRKRDARIRHLRRLPPDVHGRVTWSERRQYRRRKKEDVHGLYRPRMPGRVVGRPDMVGQERDIVGGEEDPRTRLSAEEREIEVQLWRQLDHLRRRARREKPESETRIPPEAEKQEWLAYETRVLPLRQARRGCTPGEAALVFALILSGIDRQAASRLVGVPVWWVAKIVRREPVAIAISRWQRSQRHPKPCPESLKRLVGAERLRQMRSESDNNNQQ